MSSESKYLLRKADSLSPFAFSLVLLFCTRQDLRAAKNKDYLCMQTTKKKASTYHPKQTSNNNNNNNNNVLRMRKFNRQACLDSTSENKRKGREQKMRREGKGAGGRHSNNNGERCREHAASSRRGFASYFPMA